MPNTRMFADLDIGRRLYLCERGCRVGNLLRVQEKTCLSEPRTYVATFITKIFLGMLKIKFNGLVPLDLLLLVVGLFIIGLGPLQETQNYA